MSEKPQKERLEPVVIVHGTFASNAKWWQPNERFSQDLDKALKNLNCSARCWDGAPDSVPTFGWSGRNTEVARNKASDDFSTFLIEMEVNEKIKKYHIVAHSHGGNVSVDALRKVFEVNGNNRSQSKLGALICLGTPFLIKKYHTPRIIMAWKRIQLYPFLIGFFWALFGLLILSIEKYLIFNIPDYIKFLSPFFVISALVFLVYSRIVLRPSYLGNAFRVHVILSKNDEIFHFLRLGVDIKRRTTKYLFESGDVIFESGIWNVLKKKLGWATYFDDDNSIKLFTKSNPKIDVEARIEAAEGRAGRMAIILVPLLILLHSLFYIERVILLVLEMTLGRFAKIYALKRVAKLVLGDNSIGERIYGVRKKPPCVRSNVEVIPNSIEEQFEKEVKFNLNRKIDLLYELSGTGELLNASIKQIFGDVNAIHNQYYQNASLIGRIAELIASESRDGSDGSVELAS